MTIDSVTFSYLYASTVICSILLTLLIAIRIVLYIHPARVYANNTDAATESFITIGLTNTPTTEVGALASNTSEIKIQSMQQNNNILNLTLKEFAIKASYNSACSGNFVSKDAINFVLSRGCRFIDLELYEDPSDPEGGKVMVAVSTNPTRDAYNITSRGNLQLFDALLAILVGAFAAPSPNQRDPLFLRLRLKAPPGENAVSRYAQMCRTVRGMVIATLTPRLYKSAVTGDTPVRQLVEKIILILDPVPDPELSAMASITAGTTTLRTYTYVSIAEHAPDPPVVVTGNTVSQSNVKMLRLVTPTQDVTENDDALVYTQKYGAQICGMKFYTHDDSLIKYEDAFNHFNSALIPFSMLIPYLQQQDE